MIDNIKNLIEIDEKEVLRYLQYKNQHIDSDLWYKINNCIDITKEIINPKFIFRKYVIRKSDTSDSPKEIYLQGTNINLQSNDIYDLLSDCDECILMCATLGLEIEREIRKLTYTNLTEGIIMDACATTAIEEVCDIVQAKIEKDLFKQNKYITYRYSPGYGDLDIGKNRDINNLLDSQREIGVTVTSNGIMIPRKSVVAIIGVSNKSIIRSKKSCENCNNKNNCDYRKGGDSCDN